MDELCSAMAAAPGLVSVVAEVNTGSASGIVSASGSISGTADGFVSPLLFFERALKIMIIASTHIIAIAVIEMFATVVVEVMVLAVVVVAVVTVHIDPEEPVNILSLYAQEFTQETPQSV